MYSLNQPKTYLCGGSYVLIGAVIVTPPAWPIAGYLAGGAALAQKAADKVNDWIGAKKGDMFYQTTPKELVRAYGHACLGTTGP